MSKVHVNYSDFNSNIIENVSMSLFGDTLFEVDINNNEINNIALSMKDEITSNVEVRGSIDLNALNSLLKVLSTVKKQLERTEIV